MSAPPPAHGAGSLGATGPSADVLHARWVLGCAAMGLATFALSLVSPHVPLPTETSSFAARSAFVIAFAWVAVECLLAAWLAAHVRGARATLTAAIAVPGLVALAVGALPPSAATTALVGTLLLLAGSGAGGWVGARIQHPGHLGVVAVVSSIADAASVFHASGPTSQILESAPTLSLLTLGAPMLGTPDVPPILGVGDVVMSALYVAAARKHVLTEVRTAVALAAGLAATMLAVLVLELPLPALPFLGAAMLIAHRETRLPPPHERRQAAVGVLLLVLVVAYLALRG